MRKLQDYKLTLRGMKKRMDRDEVFNLLEQEWYQANLDGFKKDYPDEFILFKMKELL